VDKFSLAFKKFPLLVLISLSTGIALALSIPPFGFWILAPLSGAVLYWELSRLRASAKAMAGFVCGIGLFVPGLWWAHSFNNAGYVVLVFAQSCFIAVGCLLAATNSRRMKDHRRHTLLWRMAAFPSALTLAEVARQSWPFGGIPLGSVVLGQAVSPLARTARLDGTFVVCYLLWFFGAVIAELVIFPFGAQQPWRHVKAGVTGGLILILVVISAMFAPNGGPAVRYIKVAAVQGGGKRGLDMEEVNPYAVYDAQLGATEQLVPKSIGLILWPEDVVALFGPMRDSFRIRQLSGLAKFMQATLVAGVTIPVGKRRFMNEAVAWAPSGKLIGTFEKVHMVPFGEYIPYRGFFQHFANLSRVPRNAVPGHGPGLLNTPAGKLDVTISYETFFPNRARAGVLVGGEVIVVPTNDSSYITSQVPSQEIAASSLQAISTGRNLVQAAPTGFSAFINNHGQVLARSALGVRAVLVHDVGLRDGVTFYDRFGKLPIVLFCLVCLLLSWYAFIIGFSRHPRRT
jgi:apolipoprotein N-acyltransferase